MSDPKEELDNVLTVVQAAEEYEVSVHSLRTYLSAGGYHEYVEKGWIRQSGRTWLLHRRFLDENFKRRDK